MRLVKISVVFFTALLVGCGSLSLEGLRENPSAMISLDVDQPYQKVYATVLGQARTCYLLQPTGDTGQLAVSDHRNNADKSGNITLKYLYDALGEEYFLNVDVKSLGENRTHVQIYYAPFTKKADGEAVKAWLENGSKACAA